MTLGANRKDLFHGLWLLKAHIEAIGAVLGMASDNADSLWTRFISYGIPLLLLWSRAFFKTKMRVEVAAWATSLIWRKLMGVFQHRLGAPHGAYMQAISS